MEAPRKGPLLSRRRQGAPPRPERLDHPLEARDRRRVLQREPVRLREGSGPGERLAEGERSVEAPPLLVGPGPAGSLALVFPHAVATDPGEILGRHVAAPEPIHPGLFPDALEVKIL